MTNDSVHATTDQPTRKVPTLDTLSPSQIAAIRAMQPFGEWALPQGTWTRPVSYFLDEGIFEREMERVFRRRPLPVGPSGLLPKPGTALAHDVYGVPILFTRDEQGKVHAFLNACQHKGAKLVEDDACHETRRLVCPYHAWTYTLSGQLFGLPRPETFVDLNKDKLGLAPLPCLESGGMIWVIIDRDAPADFSDVVPDLATDFTHLGIPTAHVYGRKTFDVKANWKLVMEPFMENYHVRRLHAGSIGKLFVDTPSVVDKFGPHQRKTQGRAEFDPKLLEDPQQDVFKLLGQVYQLFPNGILITSPYYISLMVIAPVTAGHTRVDYFMMTPGPAPNAKVEDVFARSYELILKVFGTEDFRAAEIAQAGLRSGALREVTYGGMEFTIPRYYDQLDDYVAKA